MAKRFFLKNKNGSKHRLAIPYLRAAYINGGMSSKPYFIKTQEVDHKKVTNMAMKMAFVWLLIFMLPPCYWLRTNFKRFNVFISFNWLLYQINVIITTCLDKFISDRVLNVVSFLVSLMNSMVVK